MIKLKYMLHGKDATFASPERRAYWMSVSAASVAAVEASPGQKRIRAELEKTGESMGSYLRNTRKA